MRTIAPIAAAMTVAFTASSRAKPASCQESGAAFAVRMICWSRSWPPSVVTNTECTSISAIAHIVAIVAPGTNRDTRPPRAFAFWVPIRIRMPRPDESFMRKPLPTILPRRIFHLD
jgi:hypothetical protein